MKRFASPLYAAASVLALGTASAALAEEAVAPRVVVTASPLAAPLEELAVPVTVVGRVVYFPNPGGLAWIARQLVPVASRAVSNPKLKPIT